jgi:hypothetical protein
MKVNKADRKWMEAQSDLAVQESISFSNDVHETVVVIAIPKKVSPVWVAPEAPEKYIAHNRLSFVNPKRQGKERAWS